IAHKKSIQYVLNRADKILSTSEVMAKETKKYTNKAIEVTPFGVDTNKYKPNDQYKNENKIIIGTVKTLDPKYGVDYLIKAFANSVKNNPDLDLELHIAGKGPQEQELKQLSKKLEVFDKVRFLGFLSEDQVIKTFNSFDIAAFPSIFDSESFGVAAVEAGACSVPVIVSNVGGLPEATNPGVSSIVVEKENIEELTSSLDRLINDDLLRIKMGQAGRKYVKEKFEIRDNFGKVNNIYMEFKN
ncbi:MAG: glycosyltransferase family 4 protein, partial [Tissierella sp.]|uniref:glycosyltransferase family 4 protein n=1 Tax=Tissierella sp. TaxID=41274 RepID=UPI003F9DA49A